MPKIKSKSTAASRPAWVLKAKAKTRAKTDLLFCGSGLAREKPESAAFIQNARVIVNDLREQARSHIWTVPALDFDLAFALQHSFALFKSEPL
ncbi:hypothetical protein QLG25_02815 [Pseudomonas sp. CBR-F]